MLLVRLELPLELPELLEVGGAPGGGPSGPFCICSLIWEKSCLAAEILPDSRSFPSWVNSWTMGLVCELLLVEVVELVAGKSDFSLTSSCFAAERFPNYKSVSSFLKAFAMLCIFWASCVDIPARVHTMLMMSAGQWKRV